MNRAPHIWILLLVLFTTLPRGCYEEVIISELQTGEDIPYFIKLNGVPAFEDLSDNFLLYTLPRDSEAHFSPLVEFENYESITLNSIHLTSGAISDLGSVHINHPYELIASDGTETDTFKLIFTTLPLMRVITNDNIPYEPKLESWLQLQYGNSGENNYDSTLLFESHAGIEIRGMSSTFYDKKSFGIELWENEMRVDRAVPLLGMGYTEDWFLDAMYIDNLRMRNRFSFEVWNRMETSAPDNLGKGARTGIQMEYVELFLNDRYHGLYCLGEKMDDKLIDFSYNQDKAGGVMYKTFGYDSCTSFRAYINDPKFSRDWDGWEMIYPEDFINWDPLEDLRKLVVVENDEVFTNRIGDVLDLENAANYYLFLNLILGWDNIAKNIYMARYTDNSRLFFLPWDVEATWGRDWTMKDANPNGIVGNGLFERLIALNPEGYNDSLLVMWDRYRSTIFAQEALMQMVDEHYYMVRKNGAIERENLRWDFQIDLDQEYLYISDWIETRLLNLDKHFSSPD